MFTIDTNVIIYYSKGEKVVLDFFSRVGNASILFLPTIVVVEFFSYPVLTNKEKNIFTQAFHCFSIVSLNYAIALRAGELRKKYGLHLGDAVIAATALATHTTLITRNVRDFRKIPNLKIEKV